MQEKTIKKTSELIELGLISPEKEEKIEEVAKEFSIAITPQILEIIHKEHTHKKGNTNPNDNAISKQFLPDERELHIEKEELSDPIGDEAYSPIKGLVHRYPDRCLLKPVNRCSVYCRFCFRRESLNSKTKGMNQDELQKAYNYISEHQELWEVILTGGDPFILKPKKLSEILHALVAIPHIEVIRIHTRIPVVDSMRINDEMIRAIKINKALYVMLHCNHSSELTIDAKAAISRLIDAGIPVLSQTVLLKGINDDIETLSSLMRNFVKNRIKPYYLHHGDLARGTSHFRTSIEEGQKLMRTLQGRFSGLCQPSYVLDIPGGYGKAPIGPQYCQKNQCGNYKILDYQGNMHDYPFRE